MHPQHTKVHRYAANRQSRRALVSWVAGLIACLAIPAGWPPLVAVGAFPPGELGIALSADPATEANPGFGSGGPKAGESSAPMDRAPDNQREMAALPPEAPTMVTGLASWGVNNRGQLGNGKRGPGSGNSVVDIQVIGIPPMEGPKLVSLPVSSVPVLVDSPEMLKGKTFIAVASGMAHHLALCSDGTLIAWGDNTYGQLGNGNSGKGAMNEIPAIISDSVPLKGRKIVAIAAANKASLAVCEDGSVFAWGGGAVATGRPQEPYSPSHVIPSDPVNPVPALVGGFPPGKKITAVATDGNIGLAIASEGDLYVWGCNVDGGLGNGKWGDRARNVNPTAMTTGVFRDKVFTAVAVCSGSHCLALGADSSLIEWGGHTSQVEYLVQTNLHHDDGAFAAREITSVGLLHGKTILAIALSGRGDAYSALALCSDGTLVTWGKYLDARQGPAAFARAPSRVDTTGVLRGKKITAVAGNFENDDIYGSINLNFDIKDYRQSIPQNFLALCSDGTLATWGMGLFGELGNGKSGYLADKGALPNSTPDKYDSRKGWFQDPPVGSKVPVLVDQGGVLKGKTVTAIADGLVLFKDSR